MLHLLYSLSSLEDSAQNRNRTSDTRIFSPLLYQLSYLGIHHISYCQCKLRGQDLNLRPSGYEPDELPDCSTPRQKLITFYQSYGNTNHTRYNVNGMNSVVGGEGFEPSKA